LKPGQQARLAKNGRVKVVQDENIEQVVAWKNGAFMLTKTALPDVLRQIARWYDVTVVYENGVPTGHLTGRVQRTWDLSEIVKLMNYSGFKVRVEERKLIVSQ
jgi:ferric-dicitrate binding protein FerR (iron transport regulator)